MREWKKKAATLYFVGMILCIILGIILNNITFFLVGAIFVTTLYTGFYENKSKQEKRKINQDQELLQIKAQEEAIKEKEKQELLQIQAQENFERKLKQVYVNTDREYYIIKKEDYKRGNNRENEYRKRYLLPLLNLYDAKCAKCGRMDNGFDLDHFFLSKNEGGNFSLLHRDGYLVNNAIPLCQSCNRAKGDRCFSDFFDREEMLFLFTKNRQMTLLLNQIKS
jgi:hypothetical protein